MESHAKLLTTSIDQYRHLVTEMTVFDANINKVHAKDMTLFNEQIVSLLSVAKQTDSSILAMQHNEKDREITELEDLRSELINRFLELNRKIVSHLETKKAAIHSEIATIKNGMKGLAGYHNQAGRKTGIINKSI